MKLSFWPAFLVLVPVCCLLIYLVRYSFRRRRIRKKLGSGYALFVSESEVLHIGVVAEYDKRIAALEMLLVMADVSFHEVGFTRKRKAAYRFAGAKETARILVRELQALSKQGKSSSIAFKMKVALLRKELKVMNQPLNFFVKPNFEKVFWAEIKVLWESSK